MISTVERLSPAKVKIHIEVEVAAFEDALQKAYLRQRSRINIPGFRRGKAPRKLIESIYGPKAFFQEAIDALFPQVYGLAVMEHQLNPIDDPQVTLDNAEPGAPLEMTLEVTVYPEATVGDLSGLTATRESDSVDDDAIDQEIARVREQNARVSEIEDRPVQDDDLVTIDYKGAIDGEPFEGGEAEKEQLTIGSGAFVAGFEDQIKGMNTGEERDIDITFPADYFQEDLRGKQAVFHIKLHTISTRELPDLDDEFAKDVSEFDTLDDYKKDMRAKLELAAKNRADYQYENDLIGELVERTVTEVPDIMVEREARRGLEHQARRLVGNKPDQVESLVKTFSEREDVMQYHREDATKRVQEYLAVEALIKRENLAYDPDKDEEIYKETLSGAAQEEGMTEEAFLEMLEKYAPTKNSFHAMIGRRKMLKYLKGIAEGIVGDTVEGIAEDTVEGIAEDTVEGIVEDTVEGIVEEAPVSPADEEKAADAPQTE